MLQFPIRSRRFLPFSLFPRHLLKLLFSLILRRSFKISPSKPFVGIPKQWQNFSKQLNFQDSKFPPSSFSTPNPASKDIRDESNGVVAGEGANFTLILFQSTCDFHHKFGNFSFILLILIFFIYCIFTCS